MEVWWDESPNEVSIRVGYLFGAHAMGVFFFHPHPIGTPIIPVNCVHVVILEYQVSLCPQMWSP
jgi:hypothetical protein